MPSKTARKTSPAPFAFAIHLNRGQRTEILEFLGLDAASKNEQSTVIKALEHELTLHFRLLARLPDRPLPAHIIAELKPIISHASALAKLLDVNTLTAEATTRLPHVDIDVLLSQLLALVADGECTVERLSKSSLKSDGGALNKRLRDAREAVKSSLEEFFDRNVRAEEDPDYFKKDFIDACMAKMPVYPTSNREPGKRQKQKNFERG